MDMTYHINDRNMQLLTAMVENGGGKGETVTFAFIRYMRKHLVTEFVHTFKENNLKAAVGTEVFVIDKATSEIGALQDIFPNTPIHLCAFHVMNAMQKKLNDNIRGRERRTEVMKLLRKVGFAHREEQFYDNLRDLRRQQDH